MDLNKKKKAQMEVQDGGKEGGGMGLKWQKGRKDDENKEGVKKEPILKKENMKEKQQGSSFYGHSFLQLIDIKIFVSTIKVI